MLKVIERSMQRRSTDQVYHPGSLVGSPEDIIFVLPPAYSEGVGKRIWLSRVPLDSLRYCEAGEGGQKQRCAHRIHARPEVDVVGKDEVDGADEHPIK